MNEMEFWETLEFRVCRELERNADPKLAGWWCDGFIPEEFKLESGRIQVSGLAWMGFGRAEQEEWTFLLRADTKATSPDQVVWADLLPADDAVGWLVPDAMSRRLTIRLSAAER